MSLKLGFHYHIPAYKDETGAVKVPGYLGRFIDSLASKCETLVCFLHSPRTSETQYADYTLQSPNITWVDIGPHLSVPQRLLRARRMVQPIKDWQQQLDAFLIRGPSTLLPAVAHAAGSLPIALLIVGDYEAAAEASSQPGWRKAIIRYLARRNARQQLRVARQALTFVNSHKLYEDFQPAVPNLHLTQTTTLSQTDFYERADTCALAPYHLLYTGRINEQKGLLNMVEALAQLVRCGQDVVLNLVGWAEDGDPILDRITKLAQHHDITERVVYHGFKSVGQELFAYYKQADIYLIASQSDFEGFPRTIWEAAAHSLPLVATRVGSIPYFLVDRETARLVEPRDSDQLANAITELISDASLRQRLIRNGRELARKNTLENRAVELIEHLEQWVKNNRR